MIKLKNTSDSIESPMFDPIEIINILEILAKAINTLNEMENNSWSEVDRRVRDPGLISRITRIIF